MVNVGDDLEVLGLRVSPDLDSVVYALAGLLDEQRGWGRADETWNALETVSQLGGPDWFKLGDRDSACISCAPRRCGRASRSRHSRRAPFRAFGSARRAARDRRRTAYVRRGTPAGRSFFQEWFVGAQASRQGRAASSACAARAITAPGHPRHNRCGRPSPRPLSPRSVRRRGADPRRARRSARALERRARPVRRGESARRRARCQGPCRPDARPRLGGEGAPTPHVASVYAGLYRHAACGQQRTTTCGSSTCRPIVGTPTLMLETESRRRVAEACAVGSRMKVAVVGGTGPFGRALTARLHEAGDEVVLGFTRRGARAGGRGRARIAEEGQAKRRPRSG